MIIRPATHTNKENLQILEVPFGVYSRRSEAVHLRDQELVTCCPFNLCKVGLVLQAPSGLQANNHHH